MKHGGPRQQGLLLVAAFGLVLFGLGGCQLPLAHTSADGAEMAALRAAVREQQHQLDALRHEVRQTTTPVSNEEHQGQSEPAKEPSPAGSDGAADSIGWLPVAFTPEVQLRGRIHTDAVFVDQSERNKQTVGDLENATGFRRARIGAQGTVGEQVHWVAEFDFATGTVQFMDVYLGVKQLPFLGEVRVGHMLEPFSLEAMSTSNDITFLERTGNNPLYPGLNWGVAAYRAAADGLSTFQVGGYRTGNDDVGLDVTDHGDWALTTRTTRLLWDDEQTEGRSLLHVGGAMSFRRPRNGVATFRERAGNRLIGVGEQSSTPFVPTLLIPAENFQEYNLEAAAVCGPLSLQSEWGCAAIPQTGGGFVFLHGFYLSASYFLTGEHRAYARGDGTFERTRVLSPFFLLDGVRGVIRGPGAWEVTARFDYTDFRDPDIPRSSAGLPVGDLLLQGTIGFNWYLNDSTRFMFNYIFAELRSPAFGTSHASLFSTRFAVCW